jgi:hypothetical protein
MKIKIPHLILPIFGAAIAGAFVSVDFWDTSKAAILTALSVIGAGVLVRLARGLPFTNADQFQVEEARKIASAIKLSIRALRMLIIVILGTMVSLVVVKGAVSAASLRWPDTADEINAVASSAIGLLLAYIFVRITAVIQGDVGLVDLQSDFFIKAVERKQAERFEKTQVQASVGIPPSNPKDYGKIIQ